MQGIQLSYNNYTDIESAISIVKDFDDRTPGSEIETKEHSITWFYGDADPAFGEWQAKDMLSHLEEVLDILANDMVRSLCTPLI